MEQTRGPRSWKQKQKLPQNRQRIGKHFSEVTNLWFVYKRWQTTWSLEQHSPKVWSEYQVPCQVWEQKLQPLHLAEKYEKSTSDLDRDSQLFCTSPEYTTSFPSSTTCLPAFKIKFPHWYNSKYMLESWQIIKSQYVRQVLLISLLRTQTA